MSCMHAGQGATKDLNGPREDGCRAKNNHSIPSLSCSIVHANEWERHEAARVQAQFCNPFSYFRGGRYATLRTISRSFGQLLGDDFAFLRTPWEIFNF